MRRPNDSDYEKVVDFLEVCWRGLDVGYKQKYRFSIWDQFEARVRASSYATTLVGMFERLKKHLPVRIREADLLVVEGFLRSGNDSMFLDILRRETAFLIVLLRNRLGGIGYGEQL